MLKNAIRFHYYHYQSDDVFEEYLTLLKKYQPALSEIAIFTEPSHFGYWPEAYVKKQAALLTKRIAAFHEAGFPSVGLNILDTVGHFDEAWDVFPAPPMQTMVGKSGFVSKTTLCPNTEEFHRYIAARYRLFAAIPGIDFIWVDDDFRIDTHGHAGPCYCPTCIEKFNLATGRSETFESLSGADDGTDASLAAAWRKFWEDSYTEVAKIIHDAIRSVRSDLPIGLMTGPESASVPAWQEALEITKARPGAGFYTDNAPCDILFAALRAESQVILFRKEVKDLQYEYESFPYPDYVKSRTMARLESAFAYMTGCSGIAYNLLNTERFTRTACRQTLNMIAEQYPQFFKMEEAAERTYHRGIYCSDTLGLGRELFELGLPISPDPVHASAAIYTGHDTKRLNDRQLEKLLSGAVLLDDVALRDIIDRGFGDLCGVAPGKTYDNGVIEVLTNHPLNGDYGGYLRNPFVNYMEWVKPLPVLDPCSAEVEVLSDMQTILGESRGPCMTLYRNRKGGNVAVTSFLYADRCRRIQYYGKKVQFLNLFDAIMREGLPVRIDSLHKLVPVYREDSEGRWILLIANMTFDPCDSFSFRVCGDQVGRINADGTVESVGVPSKNGTEVAVKGLAPWDFLVYMGQNGRHHRE